MVVSAFTATFSVRTPRIEGRASAPERLNVKPAEIVSSWDKSVKLRSAKVALEIAVTDTFTFCKFSDLRLAVTLIFWISALLAAVFWAKAIPGVANDHTLSAAAIWMWICARWKGTFMNDLQGLGENTKQTDNAYVCNVKIMTQTVDKDLPWICPQSKSMALHKLAYK